jgi:hypothetical protein
LSTNGIFKKAQLENEGRSSRQQIQAEKYLRLEDALKRKEKHAKMAINILVNRDKYNQFYKLRVV